MVINKAPGNPAPRYPINVVKITVGAGTTLERAIPSKNWAVVIHPPSITAAFSMKGILVYAPPNYKLNYIII